MTFYPIPAQRSSTGQISNRIPSSPSRPRHEESPNHSGASLHPASHSGHRRRSSTAGHEPPPASLSRYHNGSIFMEPNTSYKPHGERRRRASISAGSVPDSVPRSHARRSWASYQQEIVVSEDSHRRGTTRIPRKYVNKEAVRQMGLQYDEDKDGTIVILKSLPRSEVEHLVELTESIRAHRNHSHSQKKEKHVRIISEPTDSIAHPEDSQEHRHHRAPKTYVHGPPPTLSSGHSGHSGHYYVAANPRTSSHRLSRAEEEAAAAEAKARRKEYRAETSGNWIDSRRATKARHDAEDKARLADEIAHKERERTRRDVVVVR